MFSFTHSWWNTLRSSWGSAVTTLRTSLLSVFKKSQTGALSQEEQQTIKSLLLAADIGPKLT
ncbi:MAG: hypothetical protein FJ161_02340, partial [Gammaproteobacteria bacterium]|nr:hypothetical protein [Gammaproteobacteria bacterium]